MFLSFLNEMLNERFEDYVLFFGFIFVIFDYIFFVLGNVYDLFEDVKVLINWLYIYLNKVF